MQHSQFFVDRGGYELWSLPPVHAIHVTSDSPFPPCPRNQGTVRTCGSEALTTTWTPAFPSGSWVETSLYDHHEIGACLHGGLNENFIGTVFLESGAGVRACHSSNRRETRRISKPSTTRCRRMQSTNRACSLCMRPSFMLQA